MGNCWIGCNNRILRITLVGSPYLFASAHGDTMIVTCTSLSTHDIIIAISLCQMRCFDTAPICSAFPDALGIADDLFCLGVIFHHTDGTGLFVAFTGFPFQRNDIFSAVVIVENGGIETGRMKIYRLTPGTPDVLCCDEKIVHVKIPGIHGIHNTVYHIEQIFFCTIGQTGCPDALCRGQFFQIDLFIIGQHMGVQFPVFHILGVVNGNARKPLKSGNCHIVIIALAANARVGVKAR